MIIDTFLEYHGWRSDGPLAVCPYFPSWDTAGRRTISMDGTISNREMLMHPGDGVLPTKEDFQQAERALRWVLEALFRYAPYLRISRAAYW